MGQTSLNVRGSPKYQWLKFTTDRKCELRKELLCNKVNHKILAVQLFIQKLVVVISNTEKWQQLDIECDKTAKDDREV
jgi:hypothetical protein